MPANPRGWLIGVARHKALDRLRRERRRAEKEAAAVREAAATAEPGSRAWAARADDELALIFTCCHPALDPARGCALTLRCVCGLTTAEIAAAFLVPEPTMAQRLVRAKRKIRQAGIPLRVPARRTWPAGSAAVLRVVYLVFTEGHKATGGDALVRGDLCDQAIRLARALAALLPGEPEVTGLLALLLLTDARRGARVSPAGDLVLLADQDRGALGPGPDRRGRGAAGAGPARPAGPGRTSCRPRSPACHSCAPAAAAHRLAGDRRAVRRADPVRADAGGRGEPGRRGGHGRGPGGRAGHARRGRPRPAAGPLAAAAHRPGRTAAPGWAAAPTAARRLPGGAGAGARRAGARLHRPPHPGAGRPSPP